MVYYLKCEHCECSYCGKTVNSIHERFHLSPSGHLDGRNKKSVFLDHMMSNPDHKFDSTKVKILDTDSNNLKLLIKESIYIKYDSNLGSDLNISESSIDLKLF